jgi:hypothetical protein
MRYIKLFEDFESDNARKLDDSIDDKENLYPYEDRSDECEGCEGEGCPVEEEDESSDEETEDEA